MSKTLHMMVGLPRSGKSTLAKSMGFPIVQPDAIRKACNWFPFTSSMEPLVWGMARVFVEALFENHDDVVLDACNHTENRRRLWNSEKWVVKYCVVPTSADVCKKRAIETNQEYLIPVIEAMDSESEEIGQYEHN